jgi:FMN phosphatase YigB (HAD superfamily)
LQDTVYLFDVDNTLLDNDAVIADLRQHLVDTFGAESAARYWTGFEALRTELGYVDYLGALQRYRNDVHNDPTLLLMSSFLLEYPFASRLYAGSLAAVAHAATLGPTVVLSDGDVVFQPRKVQRAGLWSAFEGRVLIYIHKEAMLDDLQRRYPARRYVMVDDKLRILTAMKAVLGERLTTVFVRQGHYAHDLALIRDCPPADLTIESIGDFAALDKTALDGTALSPAASNPSTDSSKPTP